MGVVVLAATGKTRLGSWSAPYSTLQKVGVPWCGKGSWLSSAYLNKLETEWREPLELLCRAETCWVAVGAALGLGQGS